jgi:hypothetical protein
MRFFLYVPLGILVVAACSSADSGGAGGRANGAGSGGSAGSGTSPPHDASADGAGGMGTSGGAGGMAGRGAATGSGGNVVGGAAGTGGTGTTGGSGGNGGATGGSGGTTGGSGGVTGGASGAAGGGGAAGVAGKGGNAGAAGSGTAGAGGSAGGKGGTDGGTPGVDAGKGGTDGGTDMASRKRGIAYGYHSDADLAALSAGIGWWYNWAPKPDGTLMTGYPRLGVEFVPMVWGGTFDVANLEKQVPPGTKYLLTFNEPNFGAQANLTPAQAAALWPKIEMFAKARGMKIVSPAVNYCGSPCNETDPFVWLQKFFAACTGCQVDYVAMHWYACTKAALTTTLAKYEQQFGKPLWVTEFSCLDEPNRVNDAGELAYMKEAVAVLEADPMVFRYAWFSGRFANTPVVNLLAPASGQLTPLGQQYVTLPR